MDADLLLIRKMRQGDEDAVEAFVRKYYPVILRYCRVHIPDPGYAEDMTQETFARFFRSLPQYRHYGKAANYLYVIAGNCCRDHCRKHRELPLDELPEAPSEQFRSPCYRGFWKWCGVPTLFGIGLTLPRANHNPPDFLIKKWLPLRGQPRFWE